MSQLRNYTTIEQSNKLVQFLPIESADMEYLSIIGNDLLEGLLVGDVPFVKDHYKVEDSAYDHTYDRLACWSLSALLSIINNVKGWYPGIDAQVDDNKWQICMFSRETGSDTDLSSLNEELVDVCYEVIVKLHDKNFI